MRTAMIMNAFTGHPGHCWRNFLPNEILFTARSDSGDAFSAIVPAVTRPAGSAQGERQ